MRASELRNLPPAELEGKLQELRDRLITLRLKKKIGGLESPAMLRMTRRDIARVLTILNQRKKKEAK